MELADSDFFELNNGPEFIDRFVVNVTSSGQVRGSYPGIFGLATIDITTEIVCEPEFNATLCETMIINSTIGPTVSDVPVVLPSVIVTIMIISFIAVVAFTIIMCWRRRKVKAAGENIITYIRASNDGTNPSSQSNNASPYITIANVSCTPATATL